MEQTATQNKLGTKPVFGLVLAVSAPIMLSMLIQALYNIVDSIYVAKISEQALTALTFSFPVQMLMSAFAVGTSVGISSLVSRRLGAGRRDDAETAAGNGIVLSLISSLIFVAFGLFFVEFYAGVATASVENTAITAYTVEYLSIVMSCCTPIFLAICFEKLLQSTGRSVLSMVTQIAGALTNIILDPIFIFGTDAIPAYGVRGAAMATVIGQCVSCVAGLVFVALLNRDIRVRLRHLLLRRKTVSDTYKVALPAIIMQGLASVTTYLMNAILVDFSDSAVAVLGSYYKVQSFVFMPLFGLNSGIVPIVGYNYGARNKQRILLALRYGFIIGVSVMVCGVAAFELFPHLLLGMFSPSPEMLAIGIPAFRIIAPCFLPAAASIVLTAVFNGLGLGYISMINSIVRSIAVLIPSALLLSSLFGLKGVWWCYLCAELVGLVLAAALFARVYKKRISVLG